MDRKKLDKLWADLEAARRAPQTESDLVDLARRCGREKRAGGKHAMWLSPFAQHRAFPISSHGRNPEVHPHVRKVVLDHLEADAAAWEDVLERAEQRRNDNGGENEAR